MLMANFYLSSFSSSPCYIISEQQNSFHQEFSMMKNPFFFGRKESKKLNRQPHDKNELLFYIFNDIKKKSAQQKGGNRNERARERGAFVEKRVGEMKLTRYEAAFFIKRQWGVWGGLHFGGTRGQGKAEILIMLNCKNFFSFFRKNNFS